MRNLIVFSFIVLYVFIGSCAKTSGPADLKSVKPNNNLDTLVTLTATINGSIMSTDTAFGYNVKPLMSNDSTMLMNLLITGTKTKKDSIREISLTVSNFTGPNTYIINPPVVSATYYFNNQRHYATSGQIVIVSDTGYALIGNFTFTADSVSVTGGYFNVLMPY